MASFIYLEDGTSHLLLEIGDDFLLEQEVAYSFDEVRQAIIDGIDGSVAGGTGWDAEVKAKLAVTTVVRTSDTVVTVTLSAQAGYDITSTETITVIVPAVALASGGPITATPTIAISAAATGYTVGTAAGIATTCTAGYGRPTPCGARPG